MKDCIFCKIIRGEIPSHKIYEDEHTLTFLDIKPKTKGHMITIPKKHYETIYDIPEETLIDIIKITKKMSKIVKEKLNADGVNIINSNEKAAQQDINHIHFHTLPRYKDDKLNIWHKENEEEYNLDKIKKTLIN
ncbi:MAG: HIT family protein [Candidatus Woesearchaeota archaeon]